MKKLNNINNPQHPLWATLRFLFVVVGVTTVLWSNAEDFDGTELKSIIEIGLVAGGYEGVMAILKGRSKGTEE